MKTARSLAVLLCSTCFLAAQVPAAALAAPAPTMAAATEGRQVLLNAVREAVRINPALADGVGNQALLNGVRQAVWQRPELTESILASAKSIRPAMASEIDMAAQSTLAQQPVPQPVSQAAPVTPVASAPVQSSSTVAQASSGGSFLGGGGAGGAVLLGLGVVAAGTAGVMALTDSKDTDDSASVGGGATAEYQNQWGLAAINANTAYARGATGQGVKVAVLDSGLEVTHSDIDNNVAAGGYNFVENNPSVTDVDAEGHGTHVSGIIAAERDGAETANNMHGVAFGSKVLPIRIIGALGGGSDAVATTSSIVSGTNYAVAQGAQVINGSFGPDYSDRVFTTQSITAGDAQEAAAYQDAADAGVVMVFSAGNDYVDNPPVAANPSGGALYPYIRPANANTGVYNDGGSNYDFSGLEGMLLAVVATTEAGNIASFSNRCGVAADWCIAAPGDGILSLATDGSYVTMSGTSQATPHVSGAVAVLIDMFPELTPEEIVARVLQTANKTGIYANEAVYGQGFLDLAAATRPVGSLSVATGDSVHDSGASFALNQSNLNLGPAFGDGLRAALVGQKLAVFDDQKATFVVDLSDFTRNADTRFNLDESMRRFRSRFGQQTLQLADGAKLSYTMLDLGRNGFTNEDPALNPDGHSMELAYSQQIGGVEMKMNYNINPAMMFGIAQSGNFDPNGSLSRDAFSAPYLSFAKQGYSMGSAISLTDTVSMNVGAFKGHPLEDEMLSPEERAESFGQMAELAYRNKGLKVFTQVGMLSERNSFLGSRSQGAFDLNSGTHTSFAGINTAYDMTDSWSLVGSYYRGMSSPQLDSNSLFDDISDVHTESFSLGMIGSGIFHAGDSLGLLGNQPLRVINGDARMSLATGRSRSGMLYKQDYDVNLAPTGRELNLEAFYHFDLPATQTKLMSAAMYRNEPGHMEEAPDEGLFLLQLQQPF